MTTRTATIAFSPASTNGGRAHAAFRKNGGYVLACNGRWVRRGNVWSDNDAANVLDQSFACERCKAGLASGRIVWEVTELPPPDGSVPPVKFYGGPPHTRPGRWTGNP